MKRLLVVVVAALALGGLTGCKSKCRQLSEKLCDCALNSVDKDTCLRRASNNESNNPPTDDDEKTCDRLLKGCDCRLIDTTQGKIGCGLALPLTDADAGS